MSDRLTVRRFLRNLLLNGLVAFAAVMLIVIFTPYWLFKEFRQALHYWWLTVRQEWASAMACMKWHGERR